MNRAIGQFHAERDSFDVFVKGEPYDNRTDSQKNH